MAETSMHPGFSRFIRDVNARLERGRVTYSDRSFSRDPAELLSEIEEELLNVCGWSFLLWCRIHRLGRWRTMTGAVSGIIEVE
jgi:hypothetical protein